MSPFLCDGPTCISFSGGRTSALMLRRCLDAHGGTLPADTHVVFANTGRERLETLAFVNECANRWDVSIRWVERDGTKPPGQRFREVDFETASRNGEPFAELIRERNFPPSVVMRFCTQELKIRMMRDFMRAQGHDYWTNVVGLRRDEGHRVSSAKEHSDRERWDIDCPLYDAGIIVSDVSDFWQDCRGGLALERWLSLPVESRPGWDLALRPHEGNCDLCFLKGRQKRERIMRDRPDLATWWIEQERAINGRFHAHEPGYAATLDRVRRMPLLPMDLSGEDTIPCMCTD